MDTERMRMELLDILQKHMEKALPTPEGVRINFAFRIVGGVPTIEDICDAAGVSQEIAESVLSKYVHYEVAEIHESSAGKSYHYRGLTDDIKKFWRGNPQRVESLKKALEAGEAFLNSLEPVGEGEIAQWWSALQKMREEFLGTKP